MQMVIFDRSLETGALTLRQRLDLPGSPDNLELDLYRGTFTPNYRSVVVVVGKGCEVFCCRVERKFENFVEPFGRGDKMLVLVSISQ